MIKIFSSKTINITKVILLLIILTFFLPFFMVSCELMGMDEEIYFSGFQMTFGKNIADVSHQEGNLFVIFLIIPSLVLLISLFIRKIKKDTNIFKNILVILPIFNIFACITVGIAARIMFNNRVNNILGEFNTGGWDGFIDFRLSFGFLLYLLLSIALLIIGSMNYLKQRPQIQIAVSEPNDINNTNPESAQL